MKVVEGKLYKSIFLRAKGLMFSRPKTIIIEFPKEERISLHMWFVFYSINTYFLKSDKKIVEIKRLKPFTLFTSKRKAKYVIETVENLKLKKGEKVLFKT